MKKIINYILAILLSIAILFSVFSITVISKNFILKVINDNNYYEEVSKATNVEKNLIEKDINKYINSKYKKIKFDDKNYSFYINFFHYNINVYIVYFVTILIIFIVGNLFNKTKRKHNIDVILIINSIILTVFYGITYLLINDANLIGKVILKSNYYLLIVASLSFAIPVYKKFKSKYLT